jgi:hypothetical protein
VLFRSQAYNIVLLITQVARQLRLRPLQQSLRQPFQQPVLADYVFRLLMALMPESPCLELLSFRQLMKPQAHIPPTDVFSIAYADLSEKAQIGR